MEWDNGNLTNPKNVLVNCTSLEAYSHHCHNDPCLDNGTCYGRRLTFYCDCNPGWQGKTCDEKKCEPGWEGEACDTESKCIRLLNIGMYFRWFNLKILYII